MRAAHAAAREGGQDRFTSLPCRTPEKGNSAIKPAFQSLLLATVLAAFALPLYAAKPAAPYWMSVSTDDMSIPGMEAQAGGGIEGMLGGMMMKGMGGPRRTLWLDLLGPDTPRHPVPNISSPWHENGDEPAPAP